MIRLALLVGFFSLVLTGGDDLRGELEAAMAARDWKKATRLVKKLRREAERADEDELAEIQRRIGALEGLDELREREAKMKSVSAHMARIEKLLEKHREDPVASKEIGDYRDELRTYGYLVLEDFENGARGRQDVEMETSRKLVKEGRASGRFSSRTWRKEAIQFTTYREDWTGFSHAVFWVYAKEGGRLALRANRTPMFFQHMFAFPPKKWVEIRVPLKESKKHFIRKGEMTWKAVDSLSIVKPGDLAIELFLDDIRLERTPAAARRERERYEEDDDED